MKKRSLLLVALSILLSVPCALAEHYKVQESFPGFDVELDVPQGAKVQQGEEDGVVGVDMWYVDKEGPYFDLSITPPQPGQVYSLCDLSEKQRKEYTASVSQSFVKPTFEFFTTPSGNLILLTSETDKKTGDLISMDTVYLGYVFNMTMCNEDYNAFSDEEVQMMHALVESVQIIPTQAQ